MKKSLEETLQMMYNEPPIVACYKCGNDVIENTICKNCGS